MCENGVCRRVPSEAANELSTEEKVEKAKELIEKKREQKLLEEKEVVMNLSFAFYCHYLIKHSRSCFH